MQWTGEAQKPEEIYLISLKIDGQKHPVCVVAGGNRVALLRSLLASDPRFVFSPIFVTTAMDYDQLRQEYHEFNFPAELIRPE